VSVNVARVVCQASELRRDREWPVADEFPEGRRRLMRTSGTYDTVGGFVEGEGIQGSVYAQFTV
jgi:hypothetical protein